MRYFFLFLLQLTLWSYAQPRAIPNDLLESIVHIQAYDNELGLLLPQHGSGNIISANGYILTNYHVVVDDYDQIYPYHAISMSSPDDISQAPQHRYWARYVLGHKDDDLAILQIFSQVDGSEVTRVFSGLPLGNASSLQLGDTLRIIGYPGVGGDTLTFTSGIFSGWIDEDLDGAGRRWLKTDTRIASGNSGGAAFATDGSLIGIPSVVYSNRSGDYQAYLRPVNFAFPMLKELRTELLGLRLPSNTRDVYGEEGVFAEDEMRYLEEPISELRLLNSSTGSQSYGTIAPDSSVDNILAARELEGEVMHHDYVLELPTDFEQRLFIYLDGKTRDADMALRFDKEISDIDKVDYSDISTRRNSLFVLEAEELAEVERVHLRVLNYYRVPLPYTLRVSTRPFKSYDRNFLKSSRPSGNYGLVTLEDTINGSLPATAGNSLVYHSYTLLVDESVEAFSVRVSSNNDIDLAVNAETIVDDFHEADFFDDSDAVDAEYHVNYPEYGLYHIDVINLLNESSDYTLELNLREAPPKEDSPEGSPEDSPENLGADAHSNPPAYPSADNSNPNEPSSDLGFMQMLTVGETVEGRLRGYDDGAGYQFFTVEVPEGTKQMKVVLEAEGDLDMAMNYGAELENYTLPEDGGAMDAYDFEPSNDARITIRDPEAGIWYIDVINLSGEAIAIPYTITVRLR